MESRKRPSRYEDGNINEKLDKLADDIKKLPAHRKKLLEDLMKKRLYDSKEVCEILGISLPSLRRAVQIGKIKTVHVGRLLRIPAEEIERLIKDDEGLINVKEAANLLNVRPGTIRSFIKAGKIKAFRLADAGPFKLHISEIERIAREGISD
jgi:excisionase family DNA binding protein